MNSEYLRQMADGRNGTAIFNLIVALAISAVVMNLLIWVLQLQNRGHKDHFPRSVMLITAIGAFLIFFARGIELQNLAQSLFSDCITMEVQTDEGYIQDEYGADHATHIVINGMSHIYKLHQDVEVGKKYRIEYFKNSKLINKISEIQ